MDDVQPIENRYTHATDGELRGVLAQVSADLFRIGMPDRDEDAAKFDEIDKKAIDALHTGLKLLHDPQWERLMAGVKVDGLYIHLRFLASAGPDSNAPAEAHYRYRAEVFDLQDLLEETTKRFNIIPSVTVPAKIQP